ncbi:MAG TPA: DUF2892 domain-containing protein [Patescibacteria group bacterium]|nr:DUF2892 domain-containing protein [Patescibacteria group bacterium]
MRVNIGEGDRVFRILSGIIIIALGMTYQSTLILLGMIILITGLIGWCPLYQLFKISTASIEEQIGS